MSTAIERAAAVVARGGVVVFTGAGMSAEAGIPTFRDPGSVWDRFDPEVFGTWEGLAREAMERPDALARFLSELRRGFSGARPTEGHLALARLERAGLVDAIVTQNVDGLHREAGSAEVIEIHGSFARTRCLACGARNEVSRAGFVEGLDRAIAGLRAAFVSSLASVLPRCTVCGGPARPDYVAFGELPQELAEAERRMDGARSVLVVGTSGEVYPAAELPARARAAGATVILVGDSRIEADIRVPGTASRALPALARLTAG